MPKNVDFTKMTNTLVPRKKLLFFFFPFLAIGMQLTAQFENLLIFLTATALLKVYVFNFNEKGDKCYFLFSNYLS